MQGSDNEEVILEVAEDTAYGESFAMETTPPPRRVLATCTIGLMGKNSESIGHEQHHSCTCSSTLSDAAVSPGFNRTHCKNLHPDNQRKDSESGKCEQLK
eukprot:TRINITY_DN1953_c0_g1_i3.p2 TRINITY_DN1953_c0_g1~~TRINITY_DN1953_c0_g1_i3.p2  ORF type:complete len:100 (+),score=20.27 TRINITY_DN1953_c0_g1_i3:1481-1780(+)